MRRGGRLKAAADNFLGSYLSRYSSWNRYWLFGFLAARPQRLEFDLLVPAADRTPATPEEHAAMLAARLFQEQVAKARISHGVIEAALVLEWGDPVVVLQLINLQRIGRGLIATVRARDAFGREVRTTASVPVAPHDPGYEWPSGRP